MQRETGFLYIQRYREVTTTPSAEHRITTHWYVGYCPTCDLWWTNTQARASAYKHHRRTGHPVTTERQTVVTWSLPGG